MPGAYQATTGLLDLATTAANSCLAALSNPTGSGLILLIKRISARVGFVGTPAATGIAFGLTRATGTAAAGSGSASGATIGKKRTTMANAAALWRFGPTPITGLTDDGVGDFKATFLNHQVGPVTWDELVEDQRNLEELDPIVVLPGTSLVIRNRTISIAGSRAAFDFEWSEVPL
jgi:hypothetical protein